MRIAANLLLLAAVGVLVGGVSARNTGVVIAGVVSLGAAVTLVLAVAAPALLRAVRTARASTAAHPTGDPRGGGDSVNS